MSKESDTMCSLASTGIAHTWCTDIHEGQTLYNKIEFFFYFFLIKKQSTLYLERQDENTLRTAQK